MYDVLQVFATLKIVGGGGAWLATKTATKKDDEFFAKWLYWTGKATAFVTDLATSNTRPKD